MVFSKCKPQVRNETQPINKRKCNCVLLKSNILSTTIAGDDNNILSFLSFDNNRGSSSVDDHVSAVGKIIEGPRTMGFLTSLVIAMALYVLLSNPVPSHQLSQLSGSSLSSLKLVSIICKVQIWRGRGLLLFALVMIPNPTVANPSHALEFSILPNANLLLSASKNPP